MPDVKRIGLLGGTFDPVHYGHLRTAIEVKKILQLDEMRLVPCAEPVHRDAPQASPQQRLALLRQALLEFPALSVDAIEIERGGASWTIDTLRSLKADDRHVIYLLIGMDAFYGFTSWREWQAILQMANIVVMHRPDYALDKNTKAGQLLQQYQVNSLESLAGKTAGAIYLHQVSTYKESASDIRQRLRKQQSVQGMLPSAVIDSIQQQGLYQTH